MNVWQDIIAVGIVAAAVAWLATRLVRSLSGRGVSHCGGCSACHSEPQAELVQIEEGIRD
jgi:hypothetical protein